jgi:hypothetical protein
MSRAARLGVTLAVTGAVVAVLGLAHAGPLRFLSRTLAAGGQGSSALAAGATPQPPTAGDSFAPELGLPATDVVAFGASPGEGTGEVWAYGAIGPVPVSVAGRHYSDQYALLQHTDTSGWQVVPLPPDSEGKPLAPTAAGNTTPAEYDALAGQATTAGGVVLVSGQNVVVRDPGGAPLLAPAPQQITATEPAPKGVLAKGELLLPGGAADTTLPYAAIEEEAGYPGNPHTGVLIAPFHDGAPDTAGVLSVKPAVLHYDGTAWTREPIAGLSEEQEQGGFAVLAVACGGTSAAPNASSPENCWLLADYRSGVRSDEPPNRLLLFRRTPSSGSPGYEWLAQPVSGGLLGEQARIALAPLAQGAQMLTATAQGVWVDFQAAIVPPASSGAQELSDASELVIASGGVPSGSPPVLPGASVAGSWCYPTGSSCEQSLGAPLPERYRSFAWPGSSASEPGTRVVTGLPDGAMLELAGGRFTYEIGAGGEAGAAPGGAALTSPQAGQVEGWIADGAEPGSAPDGAGQSQAMRVTTPAYLAAHSEERNQLGEESVPFRRPLYAVAQAPGTTSGEAGAQAIAVGEAGQIGRYVPGVGWRSESLYNSGGQVQTPTLRGVAWPEPERAYAVGDNGAMWLWRAATGLWEPDPAKPLNFIGNLQAVAFSPGEPSIGYAVGRQGVLLKYGKSWEQVPLPAELQQANFTSIAFAGGEALATYRVVEPDAEVNGGRVETGGLAIENGSGWHVDPGVSGLLGQLPAENRVLSKVAALPDGGAVAAGPGKVLERESSTDEWHFSAQPLPEAQNVSALAAYREPSGPVRAVVSIDLDRFVDPEGFDYKLETSPFRIDVYPPTGVGQPPVFLGPDLLPNSGYLLRETANGWSDMEHAALPAPHEALPADMPARPDPVLALLLDPTGGSGLAVGGETGDISGEGVGSSDSSYQTAAALRFPAGAASADGTSSAPVASPSGETSFAVAGQAACAQACADFANDDFGPDVWLTHALQSAGQIKTASGEGLRAFLYTGGRLPDGIGGEVLTREQERYAALLGSGGGTLPVYAADSSDLGPFAPGGSAPYYPFTLTSPGGDIVRGLVLDYSNGTLGAAQEEWLRKELEKARTEEKPAIVIGNDALDFSLPEPTDSAGRTVTEAGDAGAVAQILVEGEASAYFFDYPGANVKMLVNAVGKSIPAYGTGTLGYVSPGGPSGFLLASVDTAVDMAARESYCESHGYPVSCKLVPVTAVAIPNIGQLALDATDGVQLRRSQVALFEALARRPPAGVAVQSGGFKGIELSGPDLYDQIPFDCQGPNCVYEVPTEYTFASSNPDIGGFVAHEPGSALTHQVDLNARKEPVPDEPRNPKGESIPGGHFAENSKGEPVNEKGEVVSSEGSGLFCAYNEGTTTVSITTGGLTYSEPVKVLGGSVQYPCGTVPLTNPPLLAAPAEASFTTPSIAPAGSPPASPQVASAPLPPPPAPVSPAPPPTPPPVVHHPAPAPFFAPQPLPAAVLAIVPPLSPAVARPTPPSGTAQVFEPMAVGQREREDESAEETASLFAAYRPDEGSGQGPGLMLALVVIAAGAGVGIMRRGPGRSSRRRARHSFARAGVRPRE